MVVSMETRKIPEKLRQEFSNLALGQLLTLKSANSLQV